MSTAQRSIFDPDFIPSPEWDSRIARAAQSDITRRNHNDNTNSAAANEFIQPKKSAMQDAIVKYITAQGRKGATCQEVERDLGYRHESASARMSELKAEFRIFWNGTKRALEGRRPASAFVTSEGQRS